MYSNLAAIGGSSTRVMFSHYISWNCLESVGLIHFVTLWFRHRLCRHLGLLENRVPPNLLVNQAIYFLRIASRGVPHVSVTPNWWYPYYTLFIAWIPIYGWSKAYFAAFFSTIYPLIFTKPSCANWFGLTLIPLYHTRWGPLVISWSISPAIL